MLSLHEVKGISPASDGFIIFERTKKTWVCGHAHQLDPNPYAFQPDPYAARTATVHPEPLTLKFITGLHRQREGKQRDAGAHVLAVLLWHAPSSSSTCFACVAMLFLAVDFIALFCLRRGGLTTQLASVIGPGAVVFAPSWCVPRVSLGASGSVMLQTEWRYGSSELGLRG